MIPRPSWLLTLIRDYLSEGQSCELTRTIEHDIIEIEL
jgi:hypothetical protein